MCPNRNYLIHDQNLKQIYQMVFTRSICKSITKKLGDLDCKTCVIDCFVAHGGPNVDTGGSEFGKSGLKVT